MLYKYNYYLRLYSKATEVKNRLIIGLQSFMIFQKAIIKLLILCKSTTTLNSALPKFSRRQLLLKLILIYVSANQHKQFYRTCTSVSKTRRAACLCCFHQTSSYQLLNKLVLPPSHSAKKSTLWLGEGFRSAVYRRRVSDWVWDGWGSVAAPLLWVMRPWRKCTRAAPRTHTYTYTYVRNSRVNVIMVHDYITRIYIFYIYTYTWTSLFQDTSNTSLYESFKVTLFFVVLITLLVCSRFESFVFWIILYVTSSRYIIREFGITSFIASSTYYCFVCQVKF